VPQLDELELKRVTDARESVDGHRGDALDGGRALLPGHRNRFQTFALVRGARISR
jgi:hypothetical protein